MKRVIQIVSVFSLLFLCALVVAQTFDRVSVEDTRYGGSWTRTLSDGTTLTRHGASPVNIISFGATPDDGADDVPYIQAAIDSCYTWGGGTVYIPPGEFTLGSFQAASSQHYASGTRNCLLLKSGVSIVGSGKSSILKAGASLGNYVALFAQNADSDTLKNITFSNFTIDFNVLNSVTLPDSAASYPCFGFMVWTSDGVEWTRLHMDNVASTSAIYQGGREDQNRNNIVRECIFSNVGYGSTYYDASIVRLDCERSRIVDNVFIGAAGVRGATTAIETHGRGQYVSGNQIHDFQQMMNVGGIAVHSTEGAVIVGNYGYNVASGIRLWSFRDAYDTDGDVDYGFDGLIVSDNVITLGNYFPAVEFFRSGIWTGPYDSRLNLPYRNIVISRNIIKYDIADSPTGVLASEYSAGILLNEFVGAEIGRRYFYNVDISDNIIERSFFNGIRIRGVMRDVRVMGNFIDSPGIADASVNDGDTKSYRSGILALCDTVATGIHFWDNLVIAGSGTDSVGIYLDSSGADTTWTIRNNSIYGFEEPTHIGSGVDNSVSAGIIIIPTNAAPDSIIGNLWSDASDSTLYYWNGSGWQALY